MADMVIGALGSGGARLVPASVARDQRFDVLGMTVGGMPQSVPVLNTSIVTADPAGAEPAEALLRRTAPC